MKSYQEMIEKYEILIDSLLKIDMNSYKKLEMIVECENTINIFKKLNKDFPQINK